MKISDAKTEGIAIPESWNTIQAFDGLRESLIEIHLHSLASIVSLCWKCYQVNRNSKKRVVTTIKRTLPLYALKKENNMSKKLFYKMPEGKNGKSIELFFPDGDPEGIVKVTIPFTWTGHVLIFNRKNIKTALNQEETKNPGVYLLVGENEQGKLLVIGESDDIQECIKEQEIKKDWWSAAAFITSNGVSLSEHHRRYLQEQLIKMAKENNNIILENNNCNEYILTEGQNVQMEYFLEYICLVLSLQLPQLEPFH